MTELFLNSVSIGHSFFSLGAALGLAAFCLTDIFYLRIITILSYMLIFTAGVLFPNTSIIFWSVLFVVLNCFMVVLLLLERIPLLVPEDLKPLYLMFKLSMTPREFLRMVDLSSLVQFKRGDYILRVGDEAKGLLIIKTGEVEIKYEDVVLRAISSCNFIGELSSFFKLKVTADVVCSQDVECYLLDVDLLQRLEKNKVSLYEKIFLSVSHAVCNDLIAMNQTLVGAGEKVSRRE